MTVNFSLLALDQIVNNAATLLPHVGRPVQRAARDPHGDRRRPPARRAALAQPGGLVRAHPGHPRRRARHARGRARHAVDRARGSRSGARSSSTRRSTTLEGELPDDAGPVDLDRAAVRRAGRDVTLITYGGSLPKALAAAEALAAEGIEAEVIDLRTLRPLDEAADPRVGRAHASRGGRRRGLAQRQPRGRDRARIQEERVLRARRAGRARVQRRGADPVRRATSRRRRCRRSRTIVAAARAHGGRAMAEFRMPSLGADMEAGTLLEWRVEAGRRASTRGQVVALVDTDKAEIEVEIWEDGVVERLIAEVGPDGAGRHAARAAARGGASGARRRAAPTPPRGAAAPRPRPAARAPPAPSRPRPAPRPPRSGAHARDARSRAASRASAASTSRRSPAADPAARSSRTTCGAPRGRGAAPPGPAAAARAGRAAPRATARAGMRRAIAAAMARTKREIPHYYLATTIDCARRARLAARAQPRSAR